MIASNWLQIFTNWNWKVQDSVIEVVTIGDIEILIQLKSQIIQQMKQGAGIMT